MALNLTNKTAYHQFDEHGMLVVKGDERSWRDSIGRTVLAWIAYGNDGNIGIGPIELSEAIENCMVDGILYRHPFHREVSSRDHLSYFYIYRKIRWSSDSDFIDTIAGEKITSKRGLYLWMKALTGNKRAEFWYYFWAIPGAYIGNWWLRVCRRIGRIKKERDNDLWIGTIGGVGIHEIHREQVGNYIQRNRTPWQNIWGKIILNTIPAFALHIKAWQLYVMPNNAKKDKLQAILLKRVAKRNVLVRLVLGDDTVTREEVNNVPHMTGYPSGVYLDESCRRDIREMTPEESEFNAYEKELITWLWKQ